MHFLVKIETKTVPDFKIFINSDDAISNSENYISVFGSKYTLYEENGDKIIVIGDLVSDKTDLQLKKDLFDYARNNTVFRFGGFFYIIYLEAAANKLKIFSSLFNILPIYINEQNDSILISSKIELIRNARKYAFNIDKHYVLERILFNYSLFTRTLWKGIDLLPSGCCINYDRKLIILKHFDIANYFNDSPAKGTKVLEKITDVFVNSCKKYFPSETLGISFTSGFDSRTLVAVAKYLEKDFFTYSFGINNFNDITIPRQQAKELNFNFSPIILDDNYAVNYSFNHGMQFLFKSEGLSSFARAHYSYTSEFLSAKTKYLINGNFGSELFRAFNYSGSVLTRELIDFFTYSSDNEWKNKLKGSSRLNYLNVGQFKDEYDAVIEELIRFKVRYEGLNKNEFFYVYIFEEIFRKYFGAEINFQREFLNNRSPFLDFQFIEELLKTTYSGVYNDFYTNNPIKRFKGQLPYAYIIKKCYPPLLDKMTGKGYKPKHLVSSLGKAIMLFNKLSGKYKDTNKDPYYVQRSFINNINSYKKVSIDKSFFNAKLIADQMNECQQIRDLNSIINVLSLNLFLEGKNI